jgi:hypothetical protein
MSVANSRRVRGLFLSIDRNPSSGTDVVRATFSRKGRREENSSVHPFAIRRQCSHAAPIRFSLASGVRNAECADSVTFGSLVRG